MKATHWYLGAGALVAAAAAFLSNDDRSTSTAPHPSPRAQEPAAADDTSRRVGELRASLRQVNWRLEALEAQRSAADDEPGVTATTDSPAGLPAPTTPDPPMTAGDRQLEVEQKATAIRSHMERVLAEQPADADWQRESLRQADALFEKFALDGSRLSAVDCAQSVCRISLQHDDEVARLHFVQSDALMEPPFNTELFGHYDPVAGETRLYLARQGDHLPPLEHDEL